jgi:predicted phosphohydrolase
MGNIIIIGDVHGFTKTYQKYIQRLPAGQRTIQVGDMGLGFSGVGLHKMPDEHKFLRGNHDSPEKCQAQPNYIGEYGYVEDQNIFYVSGAWSIDRYMRTEGVSWWANEELSYEQLSQAIELYAKTKPKFVVSHEAPSKAAGVLLYNLVGPYFAAKGECANSRTANALQLMLETHQPEEWVFGHYHVDKSFHVPGASTKFTCVGGMMQGGEQPHTYTLENV